MSSAFENPIETNIYDHPLNTVAINIDFASSDFYTGTPALSDETLKSLSEIPLNDKAPQEDTPQPDIDTPRSVRVNKGLADLVAKLNREDLEREQRAELPVEIVEELGAVSLELVGAGH